MIKLVMCLHRRPNITREQFQDYWLNKHGPVFSKECCRHAIKAIRSVPHDR